MSTLETLRQNIIDAELRMSEAKIGKNLAEINLSNARQAETFVSKIAALAKVRFDESVEEFKLAHDLWKTAQRNLDEATRKEARVL